jgi:hypothetical protein
LSFPLAFSAKADRRRDSRTRSPSRGEHRHIVNQNRFLKGLWPTLITRRSLEEDNAITAATDRMLFWTMLVPAPFRSSADAGRGSTKNSMAMDENGSWSFQVSLGVSL